MSDFQSTMQQTFSNILSAEPGAGAGAGATPPAATEGAKETPRSDFQPDSGDADAGTGHEGKEGVEAGAEGSGEEEFRFPDESDAAKPAADAAVADKDGISGGELTKEQEKAAESALLKTARGRQMYDTFKMMRELEKPAAEGGLGFRPSAAQIKESFSHSTDLRAMTNDFRNGNPNFIVQWFAGRNGQAPSQASLAIAEKFMPTLAQHAPEAYVRAAVPAVGNFIDELYREAATMPTEQERVLWLNISRHAEAYFTGGKFREIPDELVKTGKDPNAVDPRMAEYDDKINKIKEWETRQARQAEQSFANSVNSSIRNSLMADIEAALAPVKEQEPEKRYRAIVRQFHDDIVQTISQNPANLRTYNEALALAKSNPSEENIRKAGKAWAEAARPTIRSLRPGYVKGSLGPKAQESAERHKTLEEASQRRGGTSVASPVGKSLATGTSGPQPGESQYDFRKRQFAEILSR